MIKETLTLNNKAGLHARPASAIAKIVGKCQSKVEFISRDKVIKGKSVIGLMTAGITGGAKVEVICEGTDEEAVFLEIKALFNAGFGEE